MKITIESTNALTRIDGVPVRLWEGVTESGVRCQVFVHMLAAYEHEDNSEFERDLIEQLPPGQHLPLSLIL